MCIKAKLHVWCKPKAIIWICKCLGALMKCLQLTETCTYWTVYAARYTGFGGLHRLSQPWTPPTASCDFPIFSLCEFQPHQNGIIELSREGRGEEVHPHCLGRLKISHGRIPFLSLTNTLKTKNHPEARAGLPATSSRLHHSLIPTCTLPVLVPWYRWVETSEGNALSMQGRVWVGKWPWMSVR